MVLVCGRKVTVCGVGGGGVEMDGLGWVGLGWAGRGEVSPYR